MCIIFEFDRIGVIRKREDDIVKKIKETELYQPIKELLIKNEFQVCGEIHHCDIAAMKDDQLLIVELKTGLTMELILQAVKRQRLTEYVYIAIPNLNVIKTKKWKDYLQLIKRLGLGLIVVNFISEPYAEVFVEPSMFDLIKSLKQGKRNKQKLIKEFSGRNLDLNIGGSKGRKIMTSYKDMSLYIACCLQMFGPLSPKELRSYGSSLKKTNSILSKNFNHWFYRVKNGVYDLTEDGHKATKQYEEVSNIHKKTIRTIRNNANNGIYFN